MSTIRPFLARIRAAAKKRQSVVATQMMGRARTFEAYDLGSDTYILERGIAARLGERPSALIVPKRVLKAKARGYVFTLTSGNHAVAAIPLLDGRFWGLSTLAANQRSATLAHAILCANVVGDALEISQRDVPTEDVVAGDLWLREHAGLTLSDVIFVERNERTLEHYRHLGQEWRVKPLAWTESEMRTALAASRKRIAATTTYYHSARGVHYITLAEFRRLAAKAQDDLPAFVAGLRELVDVYEGSERSFVRMPKYRGHHEIEFFGLKRGAAFDRLIPELENLWGAIARGTVGQLGVLQKADELVALYAALLTRQTLADEDTQDFIETLYMHVTGEIYALVGEGATPAFDDRRTALPGATFVRGRVKMHGGADARTRVLIANLRGMMSKGETLEYVNVYELRPGDEDAALGTGSTREIVYKTDKRPLEDSVIEKRLSRRTRGYSEYMLARIGALRSLGLSLSGYYQMLKRRTGRGEEARDYYIRRRCEGEPMESIPANYFHTGSAAADREVLLALAALMGDAAAQNMAMKKYDPKTESPLYGIGKEIYAFAHDVAAGRMMPKDVSTCSIRGSFGWPNLAQTDENFRALANFYFAHFAHALKGFQRAHGSVAMRPLAARFMDAFTYRTRAIGWQVSVMRDRYDAFAPTLPQSYHFAARWQFVLWAIERQDALLPELKRLFYEKVKVEESDEAP